MEVLILDPAWQDEIIRSRSETKSDRWDEVSEGIYLVSPLANNEHQLIASRLNTVLGTVIDFAQLGIVCQGGNVSDRDADWTQNYRCPDVVVYLNGNSAVDRETHWVGGPDFAVEVISKGDRARAKLEFYAKVGVRELLLVDRFPWALELYRLEAGLINLVGSSDPVQSQILTSEILPLTFRLIPGEPRPRIEVAHSHGVQRWTI
jgi:Uma2 family endonuclease